jgi:long-subunit acyl-CoA synthetase (AMP-forming)
VPDLLQSIWQSGPAARIAVQSGRRLLSRAELKEKADKLAGRLQQLDLQTVALYADNGIDWILTDLACQSRGIRLVPVPLFFSADQVRHTLTQSGAGALVTDRYQVEKLVGSRRALAPQWPFSGDTKLYLLDPGSAAGFPGGTQKVTYTSGTTGTPKGVCLSTAQQLKVAEVLAAAVPADAPRHLCVLPLSTLLENLAGVYAPLLAGGTVIAPPLAALGMSGSSGLDIGTLVKCIGTVRPNTVILVPEILDALTTAAECGWRPPTSLQFAAVGGGKVAHGLLRRARAAGLPAFEGYGLSECASVVTLNVPGADRAGSVGRPLPHVDVFTDNGEIVVSGSEFLGYVDQPSTWGREPVRTGDLGHIDSDGYVVVSGRAKDQLITSFGRNLSPEWVESELTAGPLLHQAIVIGDACPFCVALVCPRDAATTDAAIDAWIERVNQRLPDYAQVLDWRRMSEPGTSANGLLTPGGKPRRAEFAAHYRIDIEHMYGTGKEAINQ